MGPSLNCRRRLWVRHRYAHSAGASVDAGLISQALEPYTRKVVGVDISAGMVDAYNQKARKSGIDERMMAVCADILAPGAEIREGLRNVDVVVCSMSYHHIEDIVNTTKVLASLLKKGGHLLVVDLMEGWISILCNLH